MGSKHPSPTSAPHPQLQLQPSPSLAKSKAKGVVKFPPYEGKLDATALHELRRFHVHPFGDIQDYCRHIPYNSGKKDFYEKTGRESFEGPWLFPQRERRTTSI